MSDKRKPVVIDLGAGLTVPGFDPAAVPPVPEGQMDAAPVSGRAMRKAVRVGSGRMNGTARVFLGAGGSLLLLGMGLALWDFVSGLLDRNAFLGALATTLLALTLAAGLLIVLRETAAIWRLRRLDVIRAEAETALATEDLAAARRVATALASHFADRPGLSAATERLRERQEEILDAAALLEEAERLLLAEADAEVVAEIERAARHVATITALVPLALADVAAALVANLRMIRRIAGAYGGRAGTIGGWRLTRAVLAHLVATGALAVGDDAIGSVAGGGLLAKLSRRFGEGFVNGALTARVGVATMDLCRPLPFRARPAPRVSALVTRALAGLFERGQSAI